MSKEWEAKMGVERLGNKKFKCAYCGKVFMVEDRRPHKFCSEECRQAYQVEYNRIFQSQRRAAGNGTPKEVVNRGAMNRYARNMWNRWLDEADTILSLAQHPEAKTLIAKYLSDTYSLARRRVRKIVNEDEEKAGEMLKKVLTKD